MAMQHAVAGSGLADVLERILDKGIVVAGDVAVSLVGVECYEGLGTLGRSEDDQPAVADLMDRVERLARACADEGLFDAGERATDQAERGKFYSQAQAILAEDLPVMQLRDYRDNAAAVKGLTGLWGIAQGNGHWVTAWIAP